LLLIPAIDIKDGRCVRLCQGDMERKTEYFADPVKAAAQWVEAGVRRLHVVDLDGAVQGRPCNVDILHELARSFPQVELQAGGGVRDESTIEDYLDVGVHYVVMGTRAVTTPHFIGDACLEFPGHVIISLDAKNSRLATDGWSKLSHHSIIDIARHCAEAGVAAIVFTDISRDGMLNSVNIEATTEVCRSVNVPVIASGGIAGLEDIRALYALVEEGLIGAITGKALYEGRLDLGEALALVESLQKPAGKTKPARKRRPRSR